MVMLFTVLVLASVGISVLVTLTRVGISSVADVNDQSEAFAARTVLFGCLDEALAQFTRDPLFTATEIIVLAGTCTLAISYPGGDAVALDLTFADADITRRLSVEITTGPVTVTRVIEQ